MKSVFHPHKEEQRDSKDARYGMVLHHTEYIPNRQFHEKCIAQPPRITEIWARFLLHFAIFIFVFRFLAFELKIATRRITLMESLYIHRCWNFLEGRRRKTWRMVLYNAINNYTSPTAYVFLPWKTKWRSSFDNGIRNFRFQAKIKKGEIVFDKWSWIFDMEEEWGTNMQIWFARNKTKQVCNEFFLKKGLIPLAIS